MAQKLYVRFAEKKDEQAVFDYYAQNAHDFVVRRDADVWKERIAAGAVTLIEDAQGKIVASSISYPLCDENGAHRWTELGSTRIAMEGIGLFSALVSAQVLRACLFEPPEDRFIAEIKVANTHSRHVFLREGAQPFTVPDAVVKKAEESITPEDRGTAMGWFHFGVEAVPHFAQNILNLLAQPKITNKKTGVEYEIDFSRCSLVSMFLPELEKIAKSDLGDPKKPDMSRGIKAQHFKP